ncbi:MAG: hypothetical protein ACKOW9_06215 [Candidatus Paceibacterota bacterium]
MSDTITTAQNNKYGSLINEMANHHSDLMTSLSINDDFEIIKCIAQYQLILGEKVTDLVQILPSKEEQYLGVCNDWQSRAVRESILLIFEEIEEGLKKSASKYEVLKNGLRVVHFTRTGDELETEKNFNNESMYTALAILEPHPILLIAVETRKNFWVFRAPMGAVANDLLHVGLSKSLNQILVSVK